MALSRSLLLFGIGAMLVAGLAAACGDDDDDTTSTATSTQGESGTATAPGSTTTGSETPGTGSTATTAPTEEQIPFETPATTFSKEPPGIEPPLLADVRAARNEGFDRVVFEFEGDEMPGYEVSYVEGVTECGSGAPVELTGEAVVSVVIRPANAHDEAGNETVPRDVPTEGTAAVREVRNFCDFEAVVGYGISLSGVRPLPCFRTRRADPPGRRLQPVATSGAAALPLEFHAEASHEGWAAAVLFVVSVVCPSRRSTNVRWTASR